MKRLILLPAVLALLLIGCGGFEGQSDIDLADNQTVEAGDRVTIDGKIVDLTGTFSTDDEGFTIDFELDVPETSALDAEDVTQSGPVFIFTPDVAGEYYLYAWVYLKSNPKNIGVDVVQITATAATP